MDGVLTASKAFTGNVGDSNTWRVGAYGPGPGGYYDGAIDEVRVYAHALSRAEIQTDMAAPVADPDGTPPSAPASFAQTGSTATTIATSWQASTDNIGVTGYRVFRAGVSVARRFPGRATRSPAWPAARPTRSASRRSTRRGNASARTTLSSQTAACNPQQPTGLVAAYPFDDAGGATAMDVSGHDRMATVVGAAWTTGKFGSALHFNGSGERVDLPALGTFYKTGSRSRPGSSRGSATSDVGIVGSWNYPTTAARCSGSTASPAATS